ncbi:MAG: hypothetical protein H6636_06980 [Anaerolineales bacterium]|nr:hypothetical protein [Anaerolineales bacterium]
MTIRYYLVPVEEVVQGEITFRGPKYFRWRFGTGTIEPIVEGEAQWLDYGLRPTMLVCANVSVADHAILAAAIDVTDVPQNIDNTISAAALQAVQDALENLKVPGTWVTTSHTYRLVLRAVAGLFSFAQRYHEMWNEQLVENNVDLGMLWQNVPLAKRQKIQGTADALNIDYSPVTGTWTIRQILKFLADFWQAMPFNFGFTTL